ncbi:MAG: amidohydrolase family protein [Candidatus Omnitrophica bacterium]|nr:amidohydrolase family protein [Candidatus Omnitrophota bacterium]
MKCPKHAETVLSEKIVKLFPEIFKRKLESPDLSDAAQDTESLKEPALEYEENAEADLVIRNARLFGENGTRDIAVSGGIVTRVGSRGDIEPVTGQATRIVDAEGNSVLPGFTDSHLHLSVAMKRRRGLNAGEIRTREEFRKKLRDFASRKSEEKVLYIFNLHYQDDPVIPSDKCRSFLDSIVEDRPLLVFAHDLHTVWANSRALDIAGLLREMPPYPPLAEELELEEKIVLGADKKPSGELREPEVGYFVTGPVQARFPVSIEESLEDLEAVCAELASHGITGVHNMALAQPAEDLSFLLLLIELEQKGRLPIRVCTSFSSIADEHMLEDVYRAYLVRKALARARRGEMTAAELHEYILDHLVNNGNNRHPSLLKASREDEKVASHPRIKDILDSSRHVFRTIEKTYLAPHGERGNPHRSEELPENISPRVKIRCDTVKIFMDGVVEKNTAYRLDKKPEEGIPEFSRKELEQLVMFADKLGMQVAAHSIGDASVRSMLDAIYRTREKNAEFDEARGHRIPHRIEHIELCRKEDIPRFGKEKVVTSMQPLHERPPVTLWHEMVPRNEWDTAFAWKDVLEERAVLVFGSDWPIVSCDVMEGIHHAVTREPWTDTGKHQALSLTQALEAYTYFPALTEYSGGIKGSISAGRIADLVILSEDISSLAENSPDGHWIRTTICDGKIVYDRNGSG